MNKVLRLLVDRLSQFGVGFTFRSGGYLAIVDEDYRISVVKLELFLFCASYNLFLDSPESQIVDETGCSQIPGD